MEYKYAGKKFQLELNDSGKIECAELMLERDTVDECKAAIRDATEKENKLPTVNVVFLSDNNIIHGTAKPKNVSTSRYSRTAEVWVSWKVDQRGHEKAERGKRWADNVYLDIPENMDILNRYVEIKNQIEQLQEHAQDLLLSAKCIETTE